MFAKIRKALRRARRATVKALRTAFGRGKRGAIVATKATGRGLTAAGRLSLRAIALGGVGVYWAVRAASGLVSMTLSLTTVGLSYLLLALYSVLGWGLIALTRLAQGLCLLLMSPWLAVSDRAALRAEWIAYVHALRPTGSFFAPQSEESSTDPKDYLSEVVDLRRRPDLTNTQEIPVVHDSQAPKGRPTPKRPRVTHRPRPVPTPATA